MGRIVYDNQGRLVSVHPGTQPEGGFAGEPPFIQRAAELHAQQVKREQSPVKGKLTHADFCKACETVEPPSDDSRLREIEQAIGQLDATDPDLWTQKDHKPTVPALTAKLGWKPSTDERDRAWQSVLDQEQPA